MHMLGKIQTVFMSSFTTSAFYNNPQEQIAQVVAVNERLLNELGRFLFMRLGWLLPGPPSNKPIFISCVFIRCEVRQNTSLCSITIYRNV